jgi:tRNA G18 (ribose-2'-O)-methylase SpoU
MGFDWNKLLKGVSEATQAASTIAEAVSEHNQNKKTNAHVEKKKAVNSAASNNKKIAKMFKTKNTDLGSLVSGFLQEAIERKKPSTIKSGDSILTDNYTKYNKLVNSAVDEMKGYGYANISKISNITSKVTPTRATRNVISTASIMFSEVDDRKIATIIKLTSGLVSTVGGDPQIAQVLTYFIDRRYPKDISNIYNLTQREQWTMLAPALVLLIQKLWQDQEVISQTLEKTVGRQSARQFMDRWRKQQIPLVGWTLLAANLINVIKGIIDPPNLE